MSTVMMPNRVTARAHKTSHRRVFHEATCESRPAQMWFQRSHEGLILFIVFYAEACRWARCLGCSLPAKMSTGHVPCKALMQQVDYVFGCPQVVRRARAIRKVIISNNGSILDRETFARQALRYLLRQLRQHLPNLRTLTLETRPEYVRRAELEFIAQVLSQSSSALRLEIAVGFEAFDDHVRNEIYRKGLELADFERLVGTLAPFGHRLKCYFMQKPVPGMTDAEAVTDIHRAMDYLARIATTYGIEINMHINPTYVAAGTVLAQAFQEGRYLPPTLHDVAQAARYARGKPFSVFIGLSDEGLAVEGGSFLRGGDESIVRAVEEFNRTQDFRILDRACEGGPQTGADPQGRFLQPRIATRCGPE